MKSKRKISKFMCMTIALMLTMSSAGLEAWAEAVDNIEENAVVLNELESPIAELQEEEAPENPENPESPENPEEPAEPEEPEELSEASYILSGNAKAMTIVLSWDAVDNAEKYKVSVYKDGETNATATVETTKATATISEKLKYTVQYSYTVAIYTENEETQEGEWKDAYKGSIVKPEFANAALPTKLVAKKVKSDDDYVQFTWTNPSGVASNAKYTVVYSTSNDVSKMKNKMSIGASKSGYKFRETKTGTFYYAFREYSTTENATGVYLASSPSAAVKMNFLGSKITKNVKWSCKVTKKTKLYKKKTGNANYGTVAKGTKGTPTAYYPKKFSEWSYPRRVQVKLSDGRTGWVAFNSIKTSAKVSSKDNPDYSRSVKEAYVKKYSSNTNYLIWVSRYTQKVNVYKRANKKSAWKLVRVCNVSTGHFWEPTKGSTNKKITGKEYKRTKVYKDGREYYFLYSTKFKGSGTFHTKCRWSLTGKLRNSISGKPTTKGCVRMYDADAKYIYKLPKGTKVIIQ